MKNICLQIQEAPKNQVEKTQGYLHLNISVRLLKDKAKKSILKTTKEKQEISNLSPENTITLINS